LDQQIGGGYRDFPRFRIKTAMPALSSFRPTHLFRSATKTFFSFAYRAQKINRVIVAHGAGVSARHRRVI